jgi:hypothetical protein
MLFLQSKSSAPRGIIVIEAADANCPPNNAMKKELSRALARVLA